jgi:hypothetical protein
MSTMKMLILISVVLLVTCYEDAETLAKRMKFYKNIKKYSNSTMDVQYDPIKGLSCIAADYLEPATRVLQVPKSHTMCPYFIYPFKFEIIEALRQVPGLNETIGVEQKFTVFILSYYLLYELYAPKEDIKQFIKENNLTDYYDLHVPDSSIFDSLPKVILTSTTLEHDHLNLLASLGFPTDKQTEVENVYSYVILHLQKTSYYHKIFPWISSLDKFLWAYSIVMSRGMSLRLNEWFILEGYKDGKHRSPVEEKNIALHQHLSKNVGSPCIIPFIDLCNHYQPKYDDLRDKRPIILDTIRGNFINTISLGYKPGEEMSYTYTMDPNNLILYFHYGFIIPYNIFNFAHLRYENSDEFTMSQFSLCKELGCLETSIKDPKNLPKLRFYKAKHGGVDETAINYARVKFLGNQQFDQKVLYRQLANNIPINYENEMNAWLWYYDNCKKTLSNERYPLMRSIRKAQKHTDICRSIEKDWRDEERQLKEWTRNKHFEMIFRLDISYKIVMQRQIKASLNQVIMNTNAEIMKLRESYLAN